MMTSVAAAFRDAVQAWRDRPFLCVTEETARNYGIQAVTMTYGATADAIATTAARYRSSGYGAGHRIGLMLENRPEALVHWFALNGLGASVVPLNPALRQPELAYLMRHSGVCLAVGSRPHTERLIEAARRMRCGHR